MGQYYKVALIDSGIRAIDNPSGYKLMEHAYFDNELVDSIMYELAFYGPMQVAWVGDYANDLNGDIYETKVSSDVLQEVYNAVWEYGEDEDAYQKYKERLEHLIPEWDSEEQKRQYRYLVNHTLRVYIDLAECYEMNKQEDKYGEWCIHPLPLLTACGNGRGGGDYYSCNPDYADVGTWAFDKLEVWTEIPQGYKAVQYHFKEKE